MSARELISIIVFLGLIIWCIFGYPIGFFIGRADAKSKITKELCVNNKYDFCKQASPVYFIEVK